MSSLLLLTPVPESGTGALPALELLQHSIQVMPAEAAALLEARPCDVIVIDGRGGLAAVRSLCRVIRATGAEVPIALVMTEGGLAAVNADWGVDDIFLSAAGPAEVEARIRLILGRRALVTSSGSREEIRAGELVIDEDGYIARLRNRSLDLTFKEFELLKHLAQHPGRVFTRAQLLQEVWGYDYFGGTRTVDVHVRRLRAKLGPEHELLIGTVRNVGYRFVVPPREDRAVAADRSD
ncbi:MAG: response regulator transcription factor [Candidatus Nanopelagicales bacterium]|nr:response regulator transcription factor [Candidatus Nanopelagicales bacterium]